MRMGPSDLNTASGVGPTPCVSLIALSFNHERYLPQFFASINANLDDLRELIFIDNGSSDGSASAMQTFLARCPARISRHMFINSPGTGVTPAVNTALRAATSEFIAVTAADDYLLEQRFTAQLAVMHRDARAQFCYSNGYVCDESGKLSTVPVHGPAMTALLTRPRHEIADHLFYPVPTLFTQCALFRRQALLDIGGWDEDLVIDDWPLNLKLFDHFPEGHRFVPAFVCAYRRHSSNASKRRFRQYMGQKSVLRKYARGADAARGLFALFAAQALASLKRLQWTRTRVFAIAAIRQRPGLRFAIHWTFHELARRISPNRIR